MKSITGTTQDRINIACKVILSGKPTTRNFDNCFEMGDGDEVMRGVYQRALKNPKLKEALPRYLSPTAYEPRWFTSSNGRIEIQLTQYEAAQGYHLGQCDADVDRLSKKPHIASQLAALKPEDVREELAGYGAWDDDELADHAENLKRLLWLACAQITDEK